jgi:4-hydroxy-2-oxoheptanedioate aldolase
VIYKSFKEALEKRPLPGFLSMYPAPGIIERIGPDWDWCWIDTQHGEWGIDNAVQGVRACNLVGIFSLVRVPGKDAGTIGKILDTACHAIMVPMVENKEQAESVVEAARFAPLGHRSYGGRRPIDLFGRAYSHTDRPQPLVVCQIESPEAVAQCDAIASTPGVDALFFGPDDMALASGMPMDQSRPDDYFKAELITVANAAARHGKIAGGVFSLSGLKQAVDWGYHLVVCCGDVPLLAQNSQLISRNCRATLKSDKPNEQGSNVSLY